MAGVGRDVKVQVQFFLKNPCFDSAIGLKRNIEVKEFRMFSEFTEFPLEWLVVRVDEEIMIATI